MLGTLVELRPVFVCYHNRISDNHLGVYITLVDYSLVDMMRALAFHLVLLDHLFGFGAVESDGYLGRVEVDHVVSIDLDKPWDCGRRADEVVLVDGFLGGSTVHVHALGADDIHDLGAVDDPEPRRVQPVHDAPALRKGGAADASLEAVVQKEPVFDVVVDYFVAADHSAVRSLE